MTDTLVWHQLQELNKKQEDANKLLKELLAELKKLNDK